MQKTIAIVGSGISGIALAYTLTERGHHVTLYERGFLLPDTSVRYKLKTNLAWEMPNLDKNLRRVSQSGRLMGANIESEIRAYVGGMAVFWEGITPRLSPNDFQIGDIYNRGINWPIDYSQIEPYYGRAESFIGVSGTDNDNPFAPPRSTPYPLPSFELSYYDEIIAKRLREKGIHLHTTPQARTRLAYGGRLGCRNTGTCNECPFDARYSPIYHLNKALETGLCTLKTNITVRRILIDSTGKASGLLVQSNDNLTVSEEYADIVVVATGAIEAPRLLLLSANDHFPDGLGNSSGHVGKHLNFHLLRHSTAQYNEKVYRGRVGFWTAQSMQFADHEERGTYGGLRIEASEVGRFAPLRNIAPELLNQSTDQFIDGLEQNEKLHTRLFTAISESDTSSNKIVELSSVEVDAFGDHVAHVNYDLSDFDERSFDFSKKVLLDMIRGSGGESTSDLEVGKWDTGHHHMGTTRMAEEEANGVVDKYGLIFGTRNVFVVGASRFSNTFPSNPTLTLLALTLLTSDFIIETALE